MRKSPSLHSHSQIFKYVQLKHILSATFLWFRPSLDVRSPWARLCSLFIWIRYDDFKLVFPKLNCPIQAACRHSNLGLSSQQPCYYSAVPNQGHRHFWELGNKALFIYPAKSNFFVRLQIFRYAGCNFLPPEELTPMQKIMSALLCVYG